MRRRREAAAKPFVLSKQVRGTCYMMSLLIFAYSLVEGDVPAGFLAVALIAGLTPPGVQMKGFRFGNEFQKMMYGFSLTLFLGALLLLFF